MSRKRVNCAKIKIVTKQQIMQIKPFLLASLPSFLFGIQKLAFLTSFFTINSSFTNTILLKTAQNCYEHRIFNKTTYLQSQDSTPALKFYMSSACDANDIFHVWCSRGCSTNTSCAICHILFFLFF